MIYESINDLNNKLTKIRAMKKISSKKDKQDLNELENLFEKYLYMEIYKGIDDSENKLSDICTINKTLSLSKEDLNEIEYLFENVNQSINKIKNIIYDYTFFN